MRFQTVLKLVQNDAGYAMRQELFTVLAGMPAGTALSTCLRLECGQSSERLDSPDSPTSVNARAHVRAHSKACSIERAPFLYNTRFVSTYL